MARRAGVLLNISSLPSPYGIGDLGKQARAFADRLADMGFGLWQILPTVPLGGGNCPYAGPSAFGGNVLYIDLEALVDLGLITEADLADALYDGEPYTVDYDFVRQSKDKLLRKAYGEADAAFIKKVRAFGDSHPKVKDYALFSAIKAAKGGAPYWCWGAYGDYGYAVSNAGLFEDEWQYRLFCQYLFFSQWSEFKK